MERRIAIYRFILSMAAEAGHHGGLMREMGLGPNKDDIRSMNAAMIRMAESPREPELAGSSTQTRPLPEVGRGKMLRDCAGRTVPVVNSPSVRSGLLS